MKRLKTIFACMLMALFSIGQVWGETVTYNVTSKTAVSASGTAPTGSSASLSVENGNNAKEQLAAGNTMTLTLSGYEGYKITAITLSMKSNASKGAGSFSAKAGTTTIASIEDAKFNTAAWHGSWSTSYVDITPTMDDDDYEIQEDEDIVLSLVASANSIYCQSFSITYEEAGSTCETLGAPTNPTSTPAQTSVELSWDAVAGASGYKLVFNGTEYNLASGTTSRTIEDLAMETEYHWTVAAKGDGTTYCPSGTATAQQSVTTLDACTANKAVYTLASKTSVTSSGALEGSTATFLNDGTNNDDQMTAEKTMTLTLSGYDGATIKGLTLGMHSNASKGAGTFSLVIGSTTVAEINTGTNFDSWFDNESFGTTYRNVHVPFANDVVVGTGENIVVTIAATTNSLYCNSFSFCYEEPAPVAVEKPAFTLATGTYLGTQSVEISCTTAGADIYYTLDGTEPSSTSTHYSSAISITETKTLKAIAIKGSDESAIASATYTIINTEHAGTAQDPYSVADAKAVIDGIGTKADAYVSGIISQVDSYNSTYKSITYWISADGTTSGQQLQVYSGKGIDGADFSSVDDVVAKATVVVKGTLKKHNDTYEFDYNNELVSYEAPVEPVVALKQAGSTVTVLNLDATSVANQAIDIVCDNFADAISSVSAVLYEESTCETEITSGAWVTDITIEAAKLTFNIADNTGEARQVWLKVVASDGSNSAFAVLTISQAKYTVDYANLPFSFTGGRADIETTDGMTQSGLGTDYSATEKLKFDGTGDYVIIKINDDPGTLSYEIKGNGFSGGTFTIQESANGESYSDLATYTDDGTIELDLDQTTRYVKFIYTSKSSGNIGLGNIAISEYVAPAVKPTITTQPEGAEYAQDDPAEALTIVAEAAIGGNLSYQWYSNDENTTEGAVAIEGADEAEYTPSTASIATTYYYCVVTEEGADEPTTSNIVAIAVSAAPEPTGTFELFSGDLVAGEFVICSGTNAMKNEVTTSPRIDVATVTISENKIQDPDASIIWKIEALTGDDAGKWTIYNEAKGVYAAFNTTDGRGVLLDEVTDFAKWTTESAYDFINVGKTSKNYLRYNPTFGFASYATTTGETLTLYMKPDGKQNAGLAYADANHLVKVGAEYTAPTLTNPNELTVSYASSDADIVAVDASTGALTIKASGKAVITASFAGNDEYRKGSASYTIYVAAQAGTAADPLSEASAVALIDLGCEMNAHVHGTVASQDGTYYTITLSDGFKFWSVKDLGNVDFETAYLKVGDEVTAYGQLAKYGSTYELATGCYLTAYTEYKEPAVSLKRSGSVVTALNVAATDVVDQEIDIECTNFADAISSVTAELYEESTCDTKITSGAWVTDITVNGTSQVIFNVADNDGDARQVWLKVTAGDGTSEASAVLTISQAKYIADYATLPFAFDGVKADIANTGGMTQSGLGSDYTGSGVTTKLKFDNTGDNLIIHINEAPDRLTYDIKGNSFSGGTFKVQVSEDGETYSDLATYTEDGTSVEHQLASTTRYIKFVYVEKSNGNIGLGNIAISKYVAPEPPVVDYTEVRNGLTAGWYYTMCLDKAVTAVQGGTIWRVLSKAENGSDIILEEVIGTLEAGRPYIFLAAASTLEVAYTGDAVLAPVTEGNNGLIGSFSQEEITQSSNNYILYNNAMYYVNSLAYVGANRAYLNMDGVPEYNNSVIGNAPGRRRVVMNVYNGNQMPTGIEGIEVSEAPRKVMIDGQLFILRDKKMYDASGRLVK